MIKVLAIFLLYGLSGAALGKTFDCREGILAALAGEEAPVLVVAIVNADGKTGSIEVADTKFEAEYEVEGLDRTWRFFTNDSQEYGYLFLIQPDGTAAYYDHETSQGELTLPDQVYLCHERTRKVPEQKIIERQQRIQNQRKEDDRLHREFEDQERRFIARNSAEMAAYQFAIAQKIRLYWAVPASAGPETRCTVRVTQLPGGEVVSVNIISCNGDAAVQRSVEAAIRRASPLPEPADSELFDRELTLNLTLEQ